MQNLLFQILQSPQDSIINSLELRLDTVEGINEFLSLLNNNNPIAFTYMKMKIKDWIDIPKRRDLLSYKNIFYQLIESSSPQNFELYCDTLEIMSYKGCIWEDFIEYLVERGLSCNDLSKDLNARPLSSQPPSNQIINTRYLRCLNFIFKKFRSLKKSNELYTEIIQSILKTSILFTKFYFESPSPLNDLNLLEIFYSLVYQDIHPFFEDNSPKFFSSFIFLYKQKDLQDCISEIYNLFISKYPECIDMTQILGSVLTSINGYDFRKYQILLNITRRKNIHAISKFKDIFIHAIQFGAKISIKEQEEITHNTLEYTRSILKNQDNYRGMVSEIINHCRIMFGDEWVSKLLNSGLDKEMIIYFYLCLKIRDENVIKECNKIVENVGDGGSMQGGSSSRIGGCSGIEGVYNNNQTTPFLTVISLRYLISINHFQFIGINCLSSNHPGRYFAFFYLRKFLDLQFGVRDFFLNSIGLRKVPSLGVDPFVLLPITLNFIISNREDEYSSNLLLCIFKIRYCLLNSLSNQKDSSPRNIQGNSSGTLGTPFPSSTLPLPQGTPSPSSTPFPIPSNLLNCFFDYIRENILNINSISSYNSLFDVLGFIYLEDKDDSFILELVDIILREDLVDLYSSTFYLLSLVVLFSKKDLSGLIQIITIEKLWSTKELRSSLVCLTTSLYKKGYCTKEQLDYILGYLPKHYSYILLVNTLSNFNLPKEDDLEEDFILKTKLIQGDLNLYRSYYNNIINYFLNNFITKKNIRRVLRGLSTGSKILNTTEGIKEIVDKNRENLDYGNVPMSVMVVFDI